MAQLIKGNYNALMWLQDELQQSLVHALNAMNAFIDAAGNHSLSDCIEAVYQIKGTVEMINLSGAAMLAEEMLQTTVALRENKVSDKDQAQDALVRALLLLPNYLKLLSDDFQDHPLSLLDSINELRQARQADKLTELHFFNPILTVQLPDSIAPNPHRQLPNIGIEQNKLGHAFQVMLLSWLRQQDNDSLRKMRGVCHYLRLACQEEKTTLLWWAGETLLEALSHEGLPASAAIKQLLGKLVQPIKIQSENSESQLLLSFPAELLSRLLLMVAKATSHGPHVTLLKTTFGLHFFDHKQKIYGMSDNALGDAHLALFEQLQDLKEQINHYNRDQDLNANIIEDVVQQLQSMTDTLALLAEYEASNLLHHQAEQLQGLIDQEQRPDDQTLTELADTLLQVEIFIQSTSQANVNDQLRSTVITECLLEMANIKETLTLMSQASTHNNELGDTARQLQLIAGSLNILNYPEAALVLDETAEKICQHSASPDPFSTAQLNQLADILACCDMYMEGIKQHGHAENDYLNDASSKLATFDSVTDAAVPEMATEAPTETGTAQLQPENIHDRALAELDSLLTDDAPPLLIESEADTPVSDSPASGEETPRHEPEAAISAAGAVTDVMPDPAQWQFAEGVDEEIAAIFIEEANEVLAELDHLLPLWLHAEDQQALSDIRRHFHTLKGSGRMAGAQVIGELAWAVEQVLNHVIDGTRPQTEAVKQLASQSHQLIPSLLARFTQADMNSTEQVTTLLELKQQCLTGEKDTTTETVETIPPASTDEIPAAPAAFTSVEEYIRQQADKEENIEFDISQYSDETLSVAVEADADNAASGFHIDTSIVTGVEQYIQRHAAENKPLTSVELYIRRQMQLTPQPPVAALPEQDDTTSSETLPLTSVDRYILSKAQQNRPVTSVARYIKQLASQAPEAEEAPEPETELSEDDELRQIFVNEATQHVNTLQQCLTEIAFSRQLTKDMLRAIHSLKGCANIAEVTPMALVATELDQAVKRLHAQNIVLDQQQMTLLTGIISGLEQILHSLTGQTDEPDIRQLSDNIFQLTPAAPEQATLVIDPEFLVVFLEETDELLDAYTQQLAKWQQQPEDQENLQALIQTLGKLKDTASQAEQTVIADLYAALAELIENSEPGDEGLDALLEQGYELLNDYIESLLQNKPVSTEKDFPALVTDFLQPQYQTETINFIDIDETEFSIPVDTDPDLLEAFTEEAQELLTSSGHAIKGWQSDQAGEQDALQLQRDLHTLKGGARLTGITPMADLTHQVETLVLAVSDNKQPANEDFFDLLQRCQDKLTEMQEQLAARESVTTAVSLIAEISQLIGETASYSIDSPVVEIEPPVQTVQPEQAAAKTTAPVHVEQVRVRADLLDYLTNFAGEVSIARDRVTQQHTALHQQLREMEETVARLHEQLRKLEIETETQILFRYEDEQLHQNSEFDPLELDRFSMIQQLSRSLTESVIDLNDISRSMDTLVKETDAILLQQSRLNTDLQQGLMNTRLLPFSGIVPRLERIVRQTAAELNKKAELQIRGAELDLDRTILDRLVAPVEHILRNAIAHGIESPEERITAGKYESGQLHLQIAREGSEMVLTISDDGQGINIEKIKQKALALNLITADNIPGDDELIQLILTSGFSTADNISQLAGRGVGMDVVSNEIRSLKGRLTIHSLPGEGTTFIVRLPLTLSVIQALLVKVQDEQYAIPLGSVNAGERISVRDIRLMLGTHKPQYQFNGEQYDFMPLASLLDKPIILPDNLKQRMPLLLFRSGDIRIALLVDAIISNREIVIKSVGQQLGHITAISGATILGDGRVVFILDIPTLIDTSSGQLHLDNNDAVNLERELEQLQERPPIAMVVDDSITMRKASGNLLKRLGFEVMTARDGVDALSQLHTQKPDIILLDVEMPRMDGFEFASIVRNDPDFRHLPIIMITSRTGEKHRERATSIGVNAYLGKPYQEDDLVENMKRLLGSSFFQGQH